MSIPLVSCVYLMIHVAYPLSGSEITRTVILMGSVGDILTATIWITTRDDLEHLVMAGKTIGITTAETIISRRVRKCQIRSLHQVIQR